MSTKPAMRQRSPEWFVERQTGIGSSDAPIIAGVASWGDVRALWAEKADIAVAPPIETNRMRWGRLLEQAISEAYTETTGRAVRRVHVIRRHRKHRFMLASLDRLTRQGKRIVEIKTQGFSHDAWGEPGTDEVPEVYRVQVQHQLAVTGYAVADIPVLFGGQDFRVYTVERDQPLIDALIELEAAFWKHVEQRIPPPPAPRWDVARPVKDGELEADEYLTDLIRRGRDAREASKAAEATSKTLDAKVKAAMGDYTAVHGLATYKPNAGSVSTDWRLVAAGYRKAIEKHGDGLIHAAFPGGLDAFESLFTQSEPGSRPLRYLKEEFSDN